jgi:hypothetical protein
MPALTLTGIASAEAFGVPTLTGIGTPLLLTGIASSEAFGNLTFGAVPLANAQFRTDFPEFANTLAYPDSELTVWMNVASIMLQPNAQRWGNLLTIGIELAAAHWLILAMRDLNAAVPGTATGLLSSKGVADLSMSYDYSRTTLADAGFWNLSSYGQRFYMLVRMMGAGGIQFGGCSGDGNTAPWGEINV